MNQNGSNSVTDSDMFECKNPSDLLIFFLVLITFMPVYLFLFSGLCTGYLKKSLNRCLISIPWMLNCILPNSTILFWKRWHKIKNKKNKKQFGFSSVLKQAQSRICKAREFMFFHLGGWKIVSVKWKCLCLK